MSLRKIAKVFATVTAVLAVVLIALYGSLPWLVSRFGADYLQQHWFNTAELEIGHPGWRELAIHQVVLASDALDLRVANARLQYQWPDLFSGKLKSIQATQVEVTLLQADDTPAEPTDLQLGPLFAAIPFEAVTVDQLHLRVPALEFTSLGHASLRDGDLIFDLKGLTPAVASQFAVDGKLSQDGRFALQFVDQAEQGSDYLDLAGRLGPRTLNVEGDTRLSGYAFDLAGAAAGLPDGAGAVQGKFALEIPWPLSLDMSLQEIAAEATQVQATWTSSDEVTAFDIAMSSAELEQGRVTATLAGKLSTQLEQFGVTVQIAEDTRLQLHAGEVTGSPGLQLVVTHPENNLSASINAFTLRSKPAPQLEFDARISAQAAGGRLAGDLDAKLSVEDSTTPMNNARGQIAFAGEVGFGDTQHDTTIEATYQLAAPKLTTTGRATASVLDNVHFTLAYDTQSGAGSLDLTDSLDLREPLAATLLPDHAEVYDIDRGLIETNLQLSWQSLEKMAAEATLSLQDVAAHYEDYTFSGISGHAELHTPDATDLAAWRVAPTTLQASSIDVGFPLDDASIDLSFSAGQLNISAASVKLLGGQASTAPFTYEPATGNAELTVNLTELDLAEVLALEGDDVSGTGTLSGALPVLIIANQPTVEDGAVHALPPGGVIQLSPALALPTGQPGLDFALSALQDFRYSDLDAKINYAANGDLQLGVSLRGSNPAIEKGRAIEYNVNISENLPVLLESLRLQDRVTERIEQQVKK